VGAFTTRYAGLAFVGAAVVVLLAWPPAQLPRARARAALWFGVPTGLSAIVLVAWNRWRTGEAFGPRWRPDEPFWNHAADGVEAIGGWFLPIGAARVLAVLFGLGVLAAVGLALAREVRVRRTDVPNPDSTIGVTVVLCAFTVVYVGYMVWARTTSGFDPLNSRLMLPIFVPALLVVLSLVDLVAARTGGVARVALLALPAVLVMPTVRNGMDVLRMSHDTGNEYTSAAVRSFVASPIVRDLPRDCELLTNDPWLLWLTGREAQLTPQRDRELAIPLSMQLDELAPVVADRPTCLVWMDTGSTVFHEPAALDDVVDLDAVSSDGFTTVYRLSPRP
jgi:hypothetical protein